MKLFIASDIHGSEFYCRKLIGAYKREEADKMLLLGDILYHGPRNDLPCGYAPKKVIELLKKYSYKNIFIFSNRSEADEFLMSI